MKHHAVKVSSMRYRVTSAPNIWTDKLYYYPEERPWWIPFWFRFSDCYENQICFSTEQKALEFIERVKESYQK